MVGLSPWLATREKWYPSITVLLPIMPGNNPWLYTFSFVCDRDHIRDRIRGHLANESRSILIHLNRCQRWPDSSSNVVHVSFVFGTRKGLNVPLSCWGGRRRRRQRWGSIIMDIGGSSREQCISSFLYSFFCFSLVPLCLWSWLWSDCYAFSCRSLVVLNIHVYNLSNALMLPLP